MKKSLKYMIAGIITMLITLICIVLVDNITLNSLSFLYFIDVGIGLSMLLILVFGLNEARKGN